MRTTTAKSLAFILTSRCLESARERARVARRLAFLGRSAYERRAWGELLDSGLLLSSLPLPDEAKSIGLYYQALACNPAGKGDQVTARGLLEQAESIAAPNFRARIILSLAAQYAYSGDREREIELYGEAIKAAGGSDLTTILDCSRMLAIRRAIEGDRRRAVADLESLSQLAGLVRLVSPASYLTWLNSLAVELNECGQIGQARRVIEPVANSLLLPVYPEWQQTAESINEQATRPILVVVAERQPEPEPAPIVVCCDGPDTCAGATAQPTSACRFDSQVILTSPVRAGPQSRAPPCVHPFEPKPEM